MKELDRRKDRSWEGTRKVESVADMDGRLGQHPASDDSRERARPKVTLPFIDCTGGAT